MALKSNKSIMAATIGFGLGCLISFFLFATGICDRPSSQLDIQSIAKLCHEGQFESQKPHIYDAILSSLSSLRHPAQWNDSASQSHLNENVLADKLKSRVRIFCWIMTSPENHKSKAVHLKATWVKRCNNFLFMSTQVDHELPSIGLNVSEGRHFLWAKTIAAFKYLYDNHLKDYDFFLKADDDTFIVMENLRYILRNSDPDSGLYVGRRFKPYVKQGYMSGGAGYVLSREALRLFVERAFHPANDSNCSQDPGGAEDVNLGFCLESVGVRILDSIDQQGRERFHPFTPESHLLPNLIPRNDWLWRYNYYPLKVGPDCCSDTTVSFHYVSPSLMYALEYLMYRLKPYGIVHNYADVRDHIVDELKSKLALPAANNQDGNV